jgi:hypothetical protein
VTEKEWFACVDHQPMLRFLHGRASDRKLRLLAVACCRHYGRWLTDERCRTAVLVAERFADGLTTLTELAEAEETVWQADQAGELAVDGLGPACACCCYRQADGSYPGGIAREVANQILCAAGAEIRSDEEYEAACATLANLVRCVFGNPFRPRRCDPAWLRWQSVVVPQLARCVYEERRFTALPILADALEEAGCTDADMLQHLRGPGPHARGCWPVDILLGKR